MFSACFLIRFLGITSLLETRFPFFEACRGRCLHFYFHGFLCISRVFSLRAAVWAPRSSKKLKLKAGSDPWLVQFLWIRIMDVHNCVYMHKSVQETDRWRAGNVGISSRKSIIIKVIFFLPWIYSALLAFTRDQSRWKNKVYLR